jgi:hypothetical protein
MPSLAPFMGPGTRFRGLLRYRGHRGGGEFVRTITDSMRKNLSRRPLQLVRSLFRALAPASPALEEPSVGVLGRPGPLFRSPRLPRIPVSVP